MIQRRFFSTPGWSDSYQLRISSTRVLDMDDLAEVRPGNAGARGELPARFWTPRAGMQAPSARPGGLLLGFLRFLRFPELQPFLLRACGELPAEHQRRVAVGLEPHAHLVGG